MSDYVPTGGRYFDDDGTELFPDLLPKPFLCITCANDDNPHQEVLCNLHRLDQCDEDDFECTAYVSKADK